MTETTVSLDRQFTWTAPGLWAMLTAHVGSLLVILPSAQPTPGVLALALVTFVVRAFCVTAGFHRLFAHRAFKTSRPLQFLFALIGGMAVMRGALWWAATHRQHHINSDREGDPHSPIHGFLWSHLGWFAARGNQQTRTHLIKDLTRYPELVWLDRHEWVPVTLFVVGCFAIGGFSGWVWGANVSTLLVCHSIFSINSFSHWLGTQKYETGDDSTNNSAVGILALGEGWHNNHHQFPSRAFLGEGPKQIDLTWYGLLLMEKLGLIWDVRRRVPSSPRGF